VSYQKNITGTRWVLSKNSRRRFEMNALNLIEVKEAEEAGGRSQRYCGEKSSAENAMDSPWQGEAPTETVRQLR
jgi:hypothetical protein